MPCSDKMPVYSTNPDVPTKRKGHPAMKIDSTASEHGIKIQREIKGRGGKTVTAVLGVGGSLKPLLKELQKHCGTGGSVKNGRIEIQGDQGLKIKTYLENKGIKAKLSGGY